MVTVTAPETEPTKTLGRLPLLQWQVRNTLERTTDISPEYLEKIADTGIKNHWWSAVKVHGFEGSGRCCAGLELEFDWFTHSIHVAIYGEEVTVNQTKFRDDLTPEVRNAVEVFSQVVRDQRLRTDWRVSYAPGVDVERIKREVGLQDAAPLTWAGEVIVDFALVLELPELQVRLLLAKSDELVAAERHPSPAEEPPARKERAKGKAQAAPVPED